MNVCLLSVALGCVAATLASAQSETEGELYEKLVKDDPGSNEALETVLRKPDEYSALVLYGGSLAAFKEKWLADVSSIGTPTIVASALATFGEQRLADSGFLFYAAQLRARFDKQCFPPEGTGGNDPFLVYSNLSMMIGHSVNPAVMDAPDVFQKALDRLREWQPKAPEGYDPGYDYKERKTEKEALDAAKPNRDDFFSHMDAICTLLKNKEYLDASRVVRAYNLADEAERPSKEEHDEARGIMKRIENEKGLEGLSSAGEK